VRRLAFAGLALGAAGSFVGAYMSGWVLAGGAADSTPRPILATANIFGAGYGDAPAPAGGGGGTLPPGWRLPTGSARVVTFPRIAGTVTPLQGTEPYKGPQGTAAGNTDVSSWRGISGIVDRGNGMFLVGVFLADGEPAVPAPARLDFTAKEDFVNIAPLIGQTFFIGDGAKRRYEVPASATRLYLGFADSYNGEYYQGQPGYYDNNAGRLEVVASGVLDVSEAALDTTAPELSGARNISVKAPRREKRARAYFSIHATDAVDGTVAVSCTSRSGSFFKLGRTAVKCTATDSSGNAGGAAFTVTVKKGKRQ